MYNSNNGGWVSYESSSVYKVRQYSMPVRKRFVNERVSYDLQDHNPAKYKWR